MSDAAPVGFDSGLVDDVLARLEQLGAEAAVDEPVADRPVVAPGHPTYDGLHEAAAVLGWFDVDRLQPTGAPVLPGARDLLIAASGPVTDDAGERRLGISPTVRVAVLRQLRESDEMPRALAANKPDPGDRVAQLIREQVVGPPRSLDDLSLAEVHSTALVCRWLSEAGFPVQSAEAIARRADWLGLLQPFELLAGRHFRGRVAELARLRAFAGVLAPGAVEKERAAAWTPTSMVPLMVFGPGGVGKSTLVARFILEHAQALERDRFPFAYLDFDRPDVDAAEPLTLLIEALRQLAIEYPGLAERATAIRTDWLLRLESARIPTPSKSIPVDRRVDVRRSAAQDFGRLLHSIGAGDRPVVFVLDTFEEVQWRSDEYVDSIWRLLTDVADAAPRLRVVIAGRGEVPGRETVPLPLTALDPDAAVAYLQAQGIDDEAVASRIAARVGGDPQNLTLAASDYLSSPHHSAASVDGYLAGLDRVMIQRKLHGRVLGHIHDPVVRQLAHPGLVLRRLTPELILQVLAGPCELPISTPQEAEVVFAELRRETALVKQDADGALIHLPELRRTILALLEADEPGRSRRIHQAAVAFYARRPGTVVERAEEIYHRLKLGQTRDRVVARWLPGVEGRLINAVDEFDGERHAFLAAQLGLAVTDEVRRLAALPDWERLVAPRVRALVDEGRPDAALALLHERSDRLPTSGLVADEAEALVRIGRSPDAEELLLDRSGPDTPADTQFQRLRLLLGLAIVSGRGGSAALVDRLRDLADRTGDATHRLAAILATAGPVPAPFTSAGRTVPELGAALAAVTDDQLRVDPDLAAMAGSWLRTPDDLAGLRRLLGVIGLPRRDESAVHRLANQVADFDRDRHGGSLARRFGLEQRASLTQAWSDHLREAPMKQATSTLIALLDTYPDLLPLPMLAALADALGAELTPRRWRVVAPPPGSVRPGTGPGGGFAAPLGHQTGSTADAELRTEVSASLAQVFSTTTLAAFLRHQFRLSLGSLVPPTAPVTEAASIVVDYLDGRGELAELVGLVREIAPADQELMAAAGRLRLSGLLATTEVRRRLLPDLPAADERAWRERLGRIEGQICRIEWRGEQLAYATGILVGPGLVLTAAHGIGTGKQPLDVRFDAVEAAGEAVSAGVVFAVDDVVVADHELGFALVALDGSPGVEPLTAAIEVVSRPRGWLELVDDAPPPEVGSALALAHHGRGGALSLAADDKAAVGYDVERGLLYHTLITGPGSSGGAVFDPALRLVALHLGWVKQAPGTDLRAGYAVSVEAIRRRLEQSGLGYVLRSTLS